MTKPRTGVLIVDDDPAVRDALSDLISSQPDLELVGAAADQQDAIRLAIRKRPRVVVLDMRMPGGAALDTVRAIREGSPTTAVLVLSAYADPVGIVEVLSAGASGYLLKGIPDDEIVEGIARAARGQMSMAAGLAKDSVEVLRRTLENERRADAVTQSNTGVLRRILDRAPYGVALLGAGGRIELINTQVQQQFGYSRTDLIGEPITRLIRASTSGEPSDAMIGRLLVAEPLGVYPREARFTAVGSRRDGTEFPVEVLVSRMPGARRGVAVYFRDAGEVRQAESRYHQLFERSPVAIIVVDATGIIQLVSAATEQLFGCSREDLIGQTVDVLLPNYQLAIYRTDSDRPALGPVSLELMGRRCDGNDFPIDVSISRIPIEGGVQMMLSIRDMTETVGSLTTLEHSVEVLRAAGNEHRNALADLVRAQERERMRLAAGIHDDSLQVVTAAGLRLQQLRRRLKDPGDLEVLSKLEESITLAAGRLRKMIFEFRPPAIEHDGLVAALKTYLEQLRSESGLSYQIDSELAEEPPLDTRIVIYRIAQEALMNIRKHARATQVRVGLSKVNDGCLVEIVDNGVGYNPLEAEGKPDHLGLALMRDRAEIAGGWYQAESMPGVGTTVEFWVPFETSGGGSS
jgi:PAS domain S-box-containing protein